MPLPLCLRRCARAAVPALTPSSPSGIGTICSALTNGRLIDYYYRREERRVGGDYRKKGEEFRLEITRFRIVVPFLW
jgi:hypothetical protein